MTGQKPERKPLDKDIQQVVFSVSALHSRKWSILSYDDCVSECFFWVANNLDKIEEWKLNAPSRWRNSVAFSLKNELNRLGGKELEYYNHNSGTAAELLTEDWTTELKKETFLETPAYYVDIDKLTTLLKYTFTAYETISEEEWEANIPFVTYKNAQSVLTDIQQATYSLTKQQKETITLLYVEKKTVKQAAEAAGVTENTIKTRRTRLVKLVESKLQSGYSSVW